MSAAQAISVASLEKASITVSLSVCLHRFVAGNHRKFGKGMATTKGQRHDK